MRLSLSAFSPVVSLLLSFALALGSARARAEPQASVGLTVGAAGTGLDRRIWAATAFHLGVHGDVLFGRAENADFGVGPYAEVLTNGFNEIQFGGGISGLFPISLSVPLVLSLGAYGRKGSDPFPLEPGLAGELFVGSRSYNFHANYVMAFGLVAQLRYGLGASRETAVVVAAQLDIPALSLPFLLLINAVRSGSRATAPVH